MSDPACNTPGCQLFSVGEAEACSNTVGILMNSEMAEIISKKDLTPVLYSDAAIRVVTWNEQWVAYGDGDTYQIKADFARGECLGGVDVGH